MPQEEAGEPQEPTIHVDEDWKGKVAEERERLREEADAKEPTAPRAKAALPPEPTVRAFLAGLYTQTLVTLGEIENPLTGTLETDLAEAAYLIDTIDMLCEKMEGNLTSQESSYVQGLLADLRMRYVGRASRPAPEGAAGQESPGPEGPAGEL